jgi:FkbM family methyltransferase
MPFDNFPMSKYRNQILENRKVNPDSDDRNTASYYLLCIARYAMLKTAIDMNPFKSTHFAWLNMCIQRMGSKNVKELPRVFSGFRDKFSTCYIDYIPKDQLLSAVRSGRCGMCSGFFTGRADYMKSFCNKIEEKFLHYLQLGYGHADEQLFSAVYFDHPEIFEVYYGDYTEMVTNYNWIQERPSEPLRLLISGSYNARDYVTCLPACKKLWDSYLNGYAVLQEWEIVQLASMYRTCNLKQELRYMNEHAIEIDPLVEEHIEQLQVSRYVTEDCVVLELGARYGMVSCAINRKLKNPRNQVSVEPDQTVWDCLEANRNRNDCSFNIFKGFVSKVPLRLDPGLDKCNRGYAATSVNDSSSTVHRMTLDDVQNQYGLRFDTLVADCEGYLESFFDENPELYSQLRLVILEQDYPEKCNYAKINEQFRLHGFICIEVDDGRLVWRKPPVTGNLPQLVYSFWTGSNEMSDSRKRSINQMKEIVGVQFVLVTKDMIPNYILKDHPLHEAYQYLSDTHKSDYLRTYFMHFYGGGYSDIKLQTGSWLPAFEQLAKSDQWMCGFKEIPGGIAYPPYEDKWPIMIGCSAFICKPQTPLTTEWYTTMLKMLDEKLELLKLHPAVSPSDHCDSGSGYPLTTGGVTGYVLHKVSYNYLDHILRTLPPCDFTWGYR